MRRYALLCPSENVTLLGAATRHCAVSFCLYSCHCPHSGGRRISLEVLHILSSHPVYADGWCTRHDPREGIDTAAWLPETECPHSRRRFVLGAATVGIMDSLGAQQPFGVPPT